MLASEIGCHMTQILASDSFETDLALSGVWCLQIDADHELDSFFMIDLPNLFGRHPSSLEYERLYACQTVAELIAEIAEVISEDEEK